MRLDIALVKNGYFDSRQKALEAIKGGLISIDSTPITKPAFALSETSSISIKNDCKIYVSRSALKLKEFLQDLGVKRNFGRGKKAIDVGASRGGFSEVLLEFDFECVTCVDVGSNQLHSKLKQNPRIQYFENCDIREFIKQYKIKSKDFILLDSSVRAESKPFDLLVCDVSFIGLEKIFYALEILSTEMILLYKPQFEVGKNHRRNKKGVLICDEAVQKGLTDFKHYLEQRGFCISCVAQSRIKGKQGNAEFFIHIKK